MTTRPGSRPRSPQPARSDQPRAWRHDPRRRFPPPRDLERDADPDRDASRGNAQRGFHDRRPRLRNGGGRDDPHREQPQIPPPRRADDRKSVVSGKSVSVRVELGVRRILKQQTNVRWEQRKQETISNDVTRKK